MTARDLIHIPDAPARRTTVWCDDGDHHLCSGWRPQMSGPTVRCDCGCHQGTRLVAWQTSGAEATVVLDEPNLDLWDGDRCTITAADPDERRAWIRMRDGREFVIDDDDLRPVLDADEGTR